MKPVLFVTGNVPAYRVGALERLHEREEIVVALSGGRLLHGGAASSEPPPYPCVSVSTRELLALAGSEAHRAVIVSTAGRLAPLAGWAGARRARVPLLLWSSLWAHPRSPAQILGYPALLGLYRRADAVVTYGPHVSRYICAHGASNVHVAPQSVENDFWRSVSEHRKPSPDERTRFLFVGRAAPEKGLEVLLGAWRALDTETRNTATLTLVGGHGHEHEDGVVSLDRLDARELCELYAQQDVLIVPSLSTPTFREPWGLVVNEAMNAGLAVIASDMVGAAAGGLVRDEETGLVVAAGDIAATAEAIARLASDAPLRTRLAANGREQVLAYDHEAWATGFSRALASVGVSRAHW